ncbi:hypothetical protein R3P38DRAFT_3090856, partial [Favolaschia claudopus]
MHLVYHSKSSGRKLLLILASLMALLSTIQCALRIALVVVALRLLRDALLNGPILATTPTGLNAARLFRSLFFSADIVLVANIVLTDGLLVYRCYCVWGHPRKIFLVIPTALIAATVATGIVTAYDQGYSFEPQHFDPYIVFGINLLTNILISLAIAGRIWWISRAQRALLGPHSSLQHSAIIAIILESGSIYCLALILSMVSLSIEIQHPTISLTIYGSVGQLINIAPMLILVRVGMGYSSPSSPNVSRMVVRPDGVVSLECGIADEWVGGGEWACGL